MENLKLYCIEKIISRRLACCHQQRKQAALDKAHAALAKELHVIKLIRSRRYFHLALKHLLGPQVRKELKNQSQFREIFVEKTEQAVAENQDKHPKTSTSNSNQNIEIMYRTPINESDVIIEQLEQGHQQKEEAAIATEKR